MYIWKLLRLYYNKVIHSIAFYPALIAFGFVLLSWGMLEVDFSDWGKEVKTNLDWISLKDASTARTIIATVAGAIISITVFSFSMVMIVLNQAASQMTNRVLTSMIENRFQQVVLGFYIGTIVYALFLLSTIRDITTGVSVPALSIYLLIVITVIDIFLFIYFLDYVTQTVKYETVIDRVRKQTLLTMKAKFDEATNEKAGWESLPCTEIRSEESGYFQGINEQRLLAIAADQKLHLEFLYKQGAFLVKGAVFIKVYSKVAIEDTIQRELLSSIDFFNGQPIAKNPEYGFKQLAEIAIKSLSPGINDPGTAVLSLHALSDIFSYRLYHELPPVRRDSNGEPRIYIPAASFPALFDDCIRPIWNYGKHDLYIRQEMAQVIEQLKEADHQKTYTEVFEKWEHIVKDVN